MVNEINKEIVQKFNNENLLAEGGFYLNNCAFADSGMVMCKEFDGELDDDGFETKYIIAFEIKENEEQDDLNVYSEERLIACYQSC